MVVALVLLVLAGMLFAPSSLNKGAVLGMLPFAAVLAIVALGQTLVVMQGGIDLSVAGSVSLVVVIVTHEPYGNDAQVLPAALAALAVAVCAGLLNGLLIGRLGLNAIVATLGTNALLYAGVLGISGGTPRQTTDLLASIADGDILGIPQRGLLRGRRRRRHDGGGQAHGGRPPLRGGRRQPRRGLDDRPDRHPAPGRRLRLGPGPLLAGRRAARRHHQQADRLPGRRYLLPSVAAVVLGGTSLLGGRGDLVATALAALFLTQLDQFVLALGVTFAVQTLIAGRGAGRRRRALHRRLVRAAAPAESQRTAVRRRDLTHGAATRPPGPEARPRSPARHHP